MNGFLTQQSYRYCWGNGESHTTAYPKPWTPVPPAGSWKHKTKSPTAWLPLVNQSSVRAGSPPKARPRRKGLPRYGTGNFWKTPLHRHPGRAGGRGALSLSPKKCSNRRRDKASTNFGGWIWVAWYAPSHRWFPRPVGWPNLPTCAAWAHVTVFGVRRCRLRRHKCPFPATNLPAGIPRRWRKQAHCPEKQRHRSSVFRLRKNRSGWAALARQRIFPYVRSTWNAWSVDNGLLD